MRLNDMLSEEQLDELGFVDKIGSGIKGAVSGFKASQSQRKGEQHSSKIVANLKAEFMKTVGGGNPPTHQNLIDFLSSHGLTDLDSISDPTTGSVQPTTPATTASTPGPTTPAPTTPSAPSGTTPVTPTSTTVDPKAQQANLKARLKTGQGMGTKTGTGFKQSRVGVPVQKLVGKNPDGSPKFATVREDVEGAGTLSNLQIDKIINDAVKKNYAKIVAAQTGRNLGSGGTTSTQPSSGSTTSATTPTQSAPVSATNAFNDIKKLEADWNDYISNGGQITRRLKKFIQTLNASIASAPATPTTPTNPAASPAPAKPTQAELDADHERMATGANEGVGYSRFLGIQL